MGAVMAGETNDTAGSVVAHREWPRYFFFFFAVICSIGAVACAIATRPDPPEVLTVDATYKDLGLVRQMDVPEASFRLTNHTSSRIEIKRVVSSCRCTTPEVDSRKLGRGESSQLHAALKIGTARKGVRAHIDVLYVREDEEKLRRLSLMVSAKVEPHYEVVPEELRFGVGQPERQRVVLQGNYLPDFSISDVASTHPAFQAAIVDADSGDARAIDVVFDRTKWLDDKTVPSVVINTDSKFQGRHRVLVRVSSDEAESVCSGE
jgi:Protein of unknown function (DUF1573)